MASKKKKYSPDPFSEQEIRKKRKFPIIDTILMVCLVVLQICMVILAIVYNPQPQDVINAYEITVEPRGDGTLDITYRLLWTPLDEDEPLTWIEIGMPNRSFTVDRTSLGGAASSTVPYIEDDFCTLEVHLDRAYTAGEQLEICFTVNQANMLCKDEDGYFYELIPSWFNATPVEHFTFRWKDAVGLTETNAASKKSSYHVWEGEMPCGTYVPMTVRYNADSFRGAQTVI